MMLILTALFSLSFAHANAGPDCSSFTKVDDAFSCLQQEASASLQPASEADRLFQQKLERALAKYDLRVEQIKVQPLQQAFRIVVEQDSFELTDQQSVLHRAVAIRSIQQQIFQAALFAAEVHASSWGHQVSLLFSVREIAIAKGGRPFHFEQRSLRLGLKGQAHSKQDILAAWNSGNPIRATDLTTLQQLPLLGKKLRELSQKDDPAGYLKDKIAEQWEVLNPVGFLRTTAIYTLVDAVFKVTRGLEDLRASGLSQQKIHKTLTAIASGPGFSNEMRRQLDSILQNEAEARGLYALWRQKLQSVPNLLSVFENGIADQIERDQRVHVVMRRIRGGVAVVNDKNIIVRVEQLMQKTIPVRDFADKAGDDPVQVELHQSVEESGLFGKRRESNRLKIDNLRPEDLSINADDARGGVVIDLIDNVVVAVKLPHISPSQYLRISLFQALQDFQVGLTSP